MNIRIVISIFVVLVSPALGFGQNAQNKQSDQIQQDISRLIGAASKLHTAWPAQGLIREGDPVVRHGKRATPFLISRLRFKKGMHFDDQGWDFHVEQQIELALCKIYEVQPESGKSVYGIRSFDEENWSVTQFWERKAASEPK